MSPRLRLHARSSSVVRVGVTDFAQQALGDVVAVTLPRPGDTVAAVEACGDVESVKSVTDLVAPVTETVSARDDDLASAPGLVNTGPYGQAGCSTSKPTRRRWGSNSRPC